MEATRGNEREKESERSSSPERERASKVRVEDEKRAVMNVGDVGVVEAEI